MCDLFRKFITTANLLPYNNENQQSVNSWHGKLNIQHQYDAHLLKFTLLSVATIMCLLNRVFWL